MQAFFNFEKGIIWLVYLYPSIPHSPLLSKLKKNLNKKYIEYEPS